MTADDFKVIADSAEAAELISRKCRELEDVAAGAGHHLLALLLAKAREAAESELADSKARRAHH